MPTNAELIRVVVGRIGRPHGIRGEVTVEVRTDEPELRFAPGAFLYVEGAAQRPPFEVESGRWHSGVLNLKLVDINDRDAAESIRGLVLESEVRADQTPAADDEYYDRQLIGLDAQVDGQIVGEVADVLHLPSQDLLVVRRADGTDVLVPFASEIVPEVDLVDGIVLITPPPGLFDEQAIEVRDAD